MSMIIRPGGIDKLMKTLIIRLTLSGKLENHLMFGISQLKYSLVKFFDLMFKKMLNYKIIGNKKTLFQS